MYVAVNELYIFKVGKQAYLIFVIFWEVLLL